ncbi:MAG: catalase, partial [Acidimicrobiales bacterium]
MRDRVDSTIDTLIAHASNYVEGTRPIHSPGITGTGWFEANPVARRYCDAEHFSGDPIPVIVRFSNGTGTHGEADSVAAVRGMAVKFLLGELTTDDHGVTHGAVETDMIGMTLPVFFVRTFDRFSEFMLAAARVPVPHLSAWQKLRQAVRLETPPRPPNPGDAALNAFADCYPPVRLGLFAANAPCRPLSYATATYHG